MAVHIFGIGFGNFFYVSLRRLKPMQLSVL